MATVTTLVDLVCQDTGLDDATGTTDRAAALSRLNHAYKQIVQSTMCLHKDYSTTPAAAATTVDLSAISGLADRFIALDFLRTYTAADGYSKPLAQADRNSILNGQPGGSSATQGKPSEYSIAWPYLFLDRPADGAFDLYLQCTVGPLALVEASAVADVSETTPTAITSVWHERLLASLACVLILERYEGRETDAAYHRGIYSEALAEFVKLLPRQGGLRLPNSGTTGFDTPSPLRSR